MAGVLLYTAATDSEGTLEGLVALGEPDVFGRLTTNNRFLDSAVIVPTIQGSDTEFFAVET